METEELIAQCFLAAQTEGSSAIDRFCEEHPALADEVRKRFAGLDSDRIAHFFS